MAYGFSNEFTYKHFLEEGKEEEFDRNFDEAVERAYKSLGKEYPIIINGKEIKASAYLTELSPIDNKTIGVFQKGDRNIARQAIEAAKEAFSTWSATSYKTRVAIIRKFAELLSRDKFDIAALLSIENGKSRYESIGEVDEGIDFARYYALDMEKNNGYIRRTMLKESSKHAELGFQGAPSNAEKVNIAMKPYGVFGIIAPFNFPISISIGMSIGAIITGNTVVFKPSSTDNMAMLSGYEIYTHLKEAGLPDGVFNYVTGSGAEVGDELVANSNVNGIAFTGSRETGMNMLAKTFGNKLQKVFVAEMGGKNPTIVSKKANIDDAVNGIVSAAFGFAGQKCSALSRVYVDEAIKDEFISKLIDKTRGISIGNPLKKEVYMGPLISESAYKRYVDAVEKIKSTGKLLYGGNRVKSDSGYYVEPVLAELMHNNELVHKELFLPVLAIISYKNFEDAIKMANDTEYGLTAGLYSNDRSEIKEFQERIEAGVVYINRRISATTGAIVGLHTFVGWKGSGLTGKGSGSRYYLQQFMREQSISVRK